ncbi:E3 ubiquitin-protein ligase RNF181 homolog [Drosophila obscura]|uniref:E3 ubiquitin-protein ligase RNF181 homolog n=1 Tax=Drosophila obscura TaxID=7282 RepID=UPI000BA05711|nr:E3 ubiquitin-protein ligase RNF181 homolog [Drosophila obscura]
MSDFSNVPWHLFAMAIMNVHNLEPKASDEVVAALTVRTVQQSELVDVQKECSVCKEPLQVGDVLKIMPCKHEFHEPCLIHWLTEANSCPLCRFQLESPDIPTILRNLHLDVDRRRQNRRDRRHRRARRNLQIDVTRRSLDGPNDSSHGVSNQISQDDSNVSSQDNDSSRIIQDDTNRRSRE